VGTVFACGNGNLNRGGGSVCGGGRADTSEFELACRNGGRVCNVVTGGLTDQDIWPVGTEGDVRTHTTTCYFC
jgi:hypothetical protein